MVSEQRRLADNFWDLRDDAYDHPEVWRGVVAGDVFQKLAQLVEAAEGLGQSIDWRVIAQAMCAWRRSDHPN